jgi:predicted NBD/HSP70 family sugar kinase
VVDGFNGILAVDIGGTNVRTAIVEPELGDGQMSGDARVWAYELWRHADGKPSRERLLGHMAERLGQAVACAESEGFAPAPFIAIACPGVIAEDGRILRGAQNLPGQWEGFNLAEYVRDRMPAISGRETVVFIHNGAVVQGLSQYPEMRRLAHWGVLTIGTGLGNARFTNLSAEETGADPHK